MHQTVDPLRPEVLRYLPKTCRRRRRRKPGAVRAHAALAAQFRRGALRHDSGNRRQWSATMSVVAAGVSPLNCRWITWNDTLPVCTRPPGPAHRVSEIECSVCEFWNEADDHAKPAHRGAVAHPPRPPATNAQDPLNPETCPRCNSTDVVLMKRDAVVQSFACSICHQRWLATRPWPLLRETRSHRD